VMRIRGLAFVLLFAFALLPIACSGDDEPEGSATTGAATTTEAAPQTTTGEAEEAPTSTGAAVGEQVDQAVIAEAAAKTTAAKTARIATLVRVVEPEGQQRFGGQGKFDFENRAGEMTLRLIEGEPGAGGGQGKAVFVDSSVYYQLPPGALGGDKRWIRLDLQNVADASGLDFGPLVQGSQADPTQYLLWLSALGPGITKIGEEEVRGVPTSRYRAAVDLNLLEQQAPPGKEAEWAAYVQALRDRLGLAFIPVEVWVDDDGLIRRFNHEYGFSAEGKTAVVTTEIFDFGIPVNVQAPPVDAVVTLTDLIRP
jgi:hypothetical protein